jgi:hypothetical protein
MTYRTLLVHIDESPRSDARVDFAFDLARKYDAHLIGLYAVCEDLRQLPFNREDSLRLAQYEAQHEAQRQRAPGGAPSGVYRRGPRSMSRRSTRVMPICWYSAGTIRANRARMPRGTSWKTS